MHIGPRYRSLLRSTPGGWAGPRLCDTGGGGGVLPFVHSSDPRLCWLSLLSKDSAQWKGRPCWPQVYTATLQDPAQDLIMYPRPPQPLPRMLAVNEVLLAVRRIIADRESGRNLVASKVTPGTATFENTIQPWLHEENRNQGIEAVIDMYRYAGPSQEIRDAAEEATRLMSESRARLRLRRDLFLLVEAVANKDDAPDEESRKAVRDMLRQHTNVGHGKLSPQEIEMLLTGRETIEQLCQNFNRNLREKAEGIWLTPAELDGVPAQEIERRTGKHDGRIYIDLGNRADRLLVLRDANSPSTRKRLYLENENKLRENIPLFRRVLVLRDDNARLLGFSNHAEFRLQDRIAASTKSVDALLNILRDKVLPLGQGATDQLRGRKKAHLGTEALKEDGILPWDFFYYMRMLEEDNQVDQEVISEYFPLHNTVLEMLELFASFLQLRFLPLAPEEVSGSIWHEDVEVWAVWDNREMHKGEFIGYLFADILYRGGKYKGNQNVNLQAVSAQASPPSHEWRADILRILSHTSSLTAAGSFLPPS